MRDVDDNSVVFDEEVITELADVRTGEEDGNDVLTPVFDVSGGSEEGSGFELVDAGADAWASLEASMAPPPVCPCCCTAVDDGATTASDFAGKEDAGITTSASDAADC